MVLSSEHTINDINKKAKKIKAMIKRGVKFLPTQVDALKIYNKLKEQN